MLGAEIKNSGIRKKLSGIKVSGKSVIIGATTKHAEVANSKEVKKAAKYVMDNPAEIPLHSIRTIASNAAVNPSTMVRLITILGFKRYDEFKTIYKKAASQMPVSNFTSHAKDLLNEKHKNPFSDVEANVYKSLSGAFNDKTYKAIDSSVDKLMKAETVYILGMRSSFSMAFYLHYLLHFILPKTKLIRGQEGMLLSEISQINANDVVIVFGASPLSLETTKALLMIPISFILSLEFLADLLLPLLSLGGKLLYHLVSFASPVNHYRPFVSLPPIQIHWLWFS